MLKKIVICFICVFMILNLSGCDFLTAETQELIFPPQLSGEMYPISQIIEKSAAGDYKMKYPARGNYRSAVIMEDINSDGILEAFAFYSVSESDVIYMNINAICKKDGKWQSSAVQKIVAGGVDKVEFCDLDGDGVKEILVGWQIYGTSEMQLSVYSLSDNALTQRIFQKYTHFTVCDLDDNNENEVLVVKTGSAEIKNTASLYALDSKGIIEISSCELDNAIKTVGEPIVSSLSNGKPAVYIDEIKGVGSVTEVLFLEKGVLVNPLLDSEIGENTATLRSVLFTTKDINGDGVPEIPVQIDVPSVTRSDLNEKLYLTNWCSFNGETLTSQMTAMINTNDSYYFAISSKLQGNIAILKDTENRSREIFSYNSVDMTIGDSLIDFRAVNKKDWDSGKYKNLSAKEIVNDGETAYICKISDTAKNQGITIEHIRENFYLYK